MAKYDPITCPRCGYEWTPRTARPKKCPNPKCQHLFIEYPDPPKKGS